MYRSLAFKPNEWPEEDNAEGRNCYGKLWKSLMRVYLGGYERAEARLRAKARG
jgi:hypothetical protein